MPLHTRILLGLGVGAALGLAANLGLGPEHAASRLVHTYIAGPLGQVFLRLLQMVVMPLVFASIALGVAGVGDVRRAGRIGARTLVFFLTTTALASALGLALVSLVEPGTFVPPDVRDRLLVEYAADSAAKLDAAQKTSFGVETLVGIVTRNPLKSAVESDMLGVIFFGLMFGAGVTLIREDRRQTMVQFLEALGEVITTIVDIAMRLAPYGVAGLIFGVTARFGFALLAPLGVYVGLVLVALALHAVGTMGLLIRALVGLSPRVFFSRIRSALVTAFSTSSSSATLPTNLAVGARELGLPPKICGFVYPLGATMCMNGTALFESVVVLFLVQVFGVELTRGQQIIVLVMCVLTATGMAGVPGGSLALIGLVLEAATEGKVPGSAIALVLGVDRVLDMCRTAVNVLGDHVAAAFVARSEGLWSPDQLPEPVRADS
mgnify:CR=1 FL=1